MYGKMSISSTSSTPVTKSGSFSPRSLSSSVSASTVGYEYFGGATNRQSIGSKSQSNFHHAPSSSDPNSLSLHIPQFGNINNPVATPSSSQSTSKFHAKRLLNDAYAFSQLHYNNSDITNLETVTIDSQSGAAYEYSLEINRLMSLKNINLSILVSEDYITVIQHYLSNYENPKLNEIISTLQTMIENDGNIPANQISVPVLPSASKGSQQNQSNEKDNKSLAKKFQKLSLGNSSGSNGTTKSHTKETKSSLDIDDEEDYLDSPKQSRNRGIPRNTNNNNNSTNLERISLNQQSPGQDDGKPRKSSKFRDKLKDAQLELYLVDDL